MPRVVGRLNDIEVSICVGPSELDRGTVEVRVVQSHPSIANVEHRGGAVARVRDIVDVRPFPSLQEILEDDTYNPEHKRPSESESTKLLLLLDLCKQDYEGRILRRAMAIVDMSNQKVPGDSDVLDMRIEGLGSTVPKVQQEISRIEMPSVVSVGDWELPKDDSISDKPVLPDTARLIAEFISCNVKGS
jgi:hypothetical protein